MELFDKTFLLSLWSSWGISVAGWLSDASIIDALQGGVFSVTLVLGVMKIYDQYLITKKRKK